MLPCVIFDIFFGSKSRMAREETDLPEPDSPTKPRVSPSNSSKETLSTAFTTFSVDSFFDPNEKLLAKDWSSKILVTPITSNNFWFLFF